MSALHNFTFNLRDPRLAKLVAHCIASSEFHRKSYGKQPVEQPALMLVKDQGAYLMSPFLRDGAPA